MYWTRISEERPDPDEHDRVLIYTEGYDFAGEQFFDVKSEDLWRPYYGKDDNPPEVCLYATHWMPRPISEWKPIETAPKDGSEILVWGGRYYEGEVGSPVRWIAHWSDSMNAWKSEGRTVVATLWTQLPPSPDTDDNSST